MVSKTSVVSTNAAIAIADTHSIDIIEENEKEIAEHPDKVNQNAQAGIRKAEAAALVWSKSAVYGIFAWYVFFLRIERSVRIVFCLIL